MKRCKTCQFCPCRCADLEAGYMGQSCLPACWPMTSVALGVHPDQVKEATEDAVKKEVPTEFTRTGEPIFRDRDHRKRYCRAYGFMDRAAGYGDAAVGSTKRDMPDRPTPKELFGDF